MKKSYFLLVFALLLPSTTKSSLNKIRELKNEAAIIPRLKHSNLAASEHDYSIMNRLMDKIYQAMLDKFAQLHKEYKKTYAEEISASLLKIEERCHVDRLTELKKIQRDNLHKDPAKALEQVERDILLAHAQQLYFAYRDLYITYQQKWYLPYIEQQHLLRSK